MQTPLALCALLVVMLLALSTQRSVAQGGERMIRNEAEALALAAAANLLDRAATRRFDANPNAATASALTPAAGFGTVQRPVAAATYVDDLHNASDVVQVATPTGAIAISRAATARYVEWDGAQYVPAAGQTHVKEVAVVATGPGGAV